MTRAPRLARAARRALATATLTVVLVAADGGAITHPHPPQADGHPAVGGTVREPGLEAVREAERETDPRRHGALEPRTGRDRPETAWTRAIDRLVAGRPVWVTVAHGGEVLYGRRDRRPRVPASNQKLLLSMALLEIAEPGERLRLRAETRRLDGGVVRGDLWLVGEGDPEVDAGTIRRLARKLRAAGIRRIQGRIRGAVSGFRRDWWAPGWKRYFPDLHIPLPTALTFEGNRAGWRPIRDPERRAAAALTRHLRALGIRVDGRPGSGRPARTMRTVAVVASRPIGALMTRMNRDSLNFHAEVLAKLLGERATGEPGSIAAGARAIRAFAAERGVRARARDGSGLSYGNRIAPADLVRLLAAAEQEPRGRELRRSLAAGGQGTLRRRLHDVRVRAKTGTLVGVSTLSGWVWLERSGTWAEFSIMSRGLPKGEAISIEDRIVRLVARRARTEVSRPADRPGSREDAAARTGTRRSGPPTMPR